MILLFPPYAFTLFFLASTIPYKEQGGKRKGEGEVEKVEKVDWPLA